MQLQRLRSPQYEFSISYTKGDRETTRVTNYGKAITRNIPQSNKIQTRSQTTKNRDAQQDKLSRDFPQQENETERAKDRNDSLDGEGDAESDNEEENQEKEEFEGHKIQKLKGKTGPIIVNDQIIKNNILDFRDLLFLRKDNVAYFIDTNGRPLDSDS